MRIYSRIFHKAILVIALLITPAAFSEEPEASPPASLESATDEERISLLIETAEKNVEELRKIQSALKMFREQEEKCIQTPEGDLLFELSRSAFQLLELIKRSQFHPYFRKDFIDELSVISNPYRKKTLSSARIR